MEVETSSGHRVSLTSFHLIGRMSVDGEFDYVFARDLRPSDSLLIYSSTGLSSSPIRSLDRVWKRGWISPLTSTGNLFVNDILVSSFALIRQQWLAQAFFFPLRLSSRFFSSSSSFLVQRRSSIGSARPFDRLIEWLYPRLCHLPVDALLYCPRRREGNETELFVFTVHSDGNFIRE